MGIMGNESPSPIIEVERLTFFNYSHLKDFLPRIFYYATGSTSERGRCFVGHGLESGSGPNEMKVVEALHRGCHLSDTVSIANGSGILTETNQNKIPIPPQRFDKLLNMLHVVSPNTHFEVVTRRQPYLDS